MSWRYHAPSFEADALNRELAISPWVGHRRFAYDLVRFLEPARLVELGTHIGGSFFAFCQAAKDARFSTELWAVDTWQGDEHAGFYGEDVYRLVARTVEERFSGEQVRLQRMLFDEAARLVEDDSVDVIHIDGLHTYEATRHDFETWLPKLRREGVMLFHDVEGQAREAGYGSVKVWSELKEKYPALTFQHSWGLGVLFPHGAARREAIADGDFERSRRLYEYGAARDLALERAVHDLEWERNRANKEWERAGQLATDLEWQKGVTNEHWRRAEDLDAALRAQREREQVNTEALARELSALKSQLDALKGELLERQRFFDLLPGRLWNAMRRLKKAF